MSNNQQNELKDSPTETINQMEGWQGKFGRKFSSAADNSDRAMKSG